MVNQKVIPNAREESTFYAEFSLFFSFLSFPVEKIECFLGFLFKVIIFALLFGSHSAVEVKKMLF
jgi:hypothetical protein